MKPWDCAGRTSTSTQGTLTVRRALQRRPAEHGCGGTCRRTRAADCPYRTRTGLSFVDVKSRAGRRTVVLPAQLAEALKRHRTAQDAERRRAGSMWGGHDLVFAQIDGRPIDAHRDWHD